MTTLALIASPGKIRALKIGLVRHLNILTGLSDLAGKRGIMTISVSAKNTDTYRPIPIIGKMANYRPIPIPILLSVEHY